MTPSAAAPGRPKRSSAEILADAASELFLEQGWAGTTVDQIASRAGVSRGTFFNYFASKSDLLWLDLDRSLAGLPDTLRAAGDQDAVRAASTALVAVARAHDPGGVPWALTQGEAMGLGDDLTASGAARFVAANAAVSSFVATRLGERQDAAWPQLVATTLVAAAGSAFVGWARAGIGRGPLDEWVSSALAPIAQGLAGYVP